MCPPPAVYGHTCTAGALVSSGLVDRFLHLCLPGNDDKRVCAQCWWGHPPSQKPLIGWMPHLSRVPPRSYRIWPLLPSRNDAAFGEQVILFRGKNITAKRLPSFMRWWFCSSRVFGFWQAVSSASQDLAKLGSCWRRYLVCREASHSLFTLGRRSHILFIHQVTCSVKFDCGAFTYPMPGMGLTSRA